MRRETSIRVGWQCGNGWGWQHLILTGEFVAKMQNVVGNGVAAGRVALPATRETDDDNIVRMIWGDGEAGRQNLRESIGPYETHTWKFPASSLMRDLLRHWVKILLFVIGTKGNFIKCMLPKKHIICHMLLVSQWQMGQVMSMTHGWYSRGFSLSQRFIGIFWKYYMHVNVEINN